MRGRHRPCNATVSPGGKTPFTAIPWMETKKALKWPEKPSHYVHQTLWNQSFEALVFVQTMSVVFIIRGPNCQTQMYVCLCVKGLWELPTKGCRALESMFTRSSHFLHQTSLKHNASETVVCDQILYFKYTIMKQRLTSLKEVCRSRWVPTQQCRILKAMLCI